MAMSPGALDWGVAGQSEPVHDAPGFPACSFFHSSCCVAKNSCRCASLAFAISSFSPGRRLRIRPTVAGCHLPPLLAGTPIRLSSRANLTGLSLVKTLSAVKKIDSFHLFRRNTLQQYAYSYCAVACRQSAGQRWRMRFWRGTGGRIELLGEAHLRRLLHVYTEYYNTYRTHLGLDKDTPLRRPVQHRGRITPMPKLGGLHHAYVRI